VTIAAVDVESKISELVDDVAIAGPDRVGDTRLARHDY